MLLRNGEKGLMIDTIPAFWRRMDRRTDGQTDARQKRKTISRPACYACRRAAKKLQTQIVLFRTILTETFPTCPSCWCEPERSPDTSVSTSSTTGAWPWHRRRRLRRDWRWFRQQLNWSRPVRRTVWSARAATVDVSAAMWARSRNIVARTW